MDWSLIEAVFILSPSRFFFSLYCLRLFVVCLCCFNSYNCNRMMRVVEAIGHFKLASRELELSHETVNFGSLDGLVPT
jgi:hypothetical protein